MSGSCRTSWDPCHEVRDCLHLIASPKKSPSFLSHFSKPRNKEVEEGGRTGQRDLKRAGLTTPQCCKAAGVSDETLLVQRGGFDGWFDAGRGRSSRQPQQPQQRAQLFPQQQ